MGNYDYLARRMLTVDRGSAHDRSRIRENRQDWEGKRWRTSYRSIEREFHSTSASAELTNAAMASSSKSKAWRPTTSRSIFRDGEVSERKREGARGRVEETLEITQGGESDYVYD